MHSIGIHKVISQIVNFFYYIGFWHRGDKPTTKEVRVKLLYCIYYAYFALSTVVGAIKNEKLDKKIFLLESSIITAVFCVKLAFLIWKQNSILNLLNRVCIFTIRYDEDLEFFNGTLRGFIKFVIAFVVLLVIAGFEVTFVPFVGSDKYLLFEIGFPWDYRNSEIAFWIVHIFTVAAAFLSLTVSPFSIIIWYLLLFCAMRYEILGNELKRTGQISEEIKMSERYKQNIFVQDLKKSVDVHLHTRQLTDELGSFFSDIFFIQFGTSALCICGTIYCLTFNVDGNLLERCVHLIALFYCIAELFLITYCGNEIMLSSDRLSYSLFESDWIEQPLATKKLIITFGEYLKQPHRLIIGKLYPLTLETFTKILNSAYSMFNILKNFKK